MDVSSDGEGESLGVCSQATETHVATDNLTCTDCREPTQKCHRVFLQCGCRYCLRCFIKKQAQMRNIDLLCCGVGVKSFSWEREEASVGQVGDDVADERGQAEMAGETAELHETINVTPSRHKWKEHFDSFRIFMTTLYRGKAGNPDAEVARLRIGNGLLYTGVHRVTWDEDKGHPAFQTMDYVLSSTGEYFPTRNDLTRMQTAFTYLHAAIYPLSTRDAVVEENGVEDLQDACAANDPKCHTVADLISSRVESKQLLGKIVYSLATGKICFRVTQENDDANPATAVDVTSGRSDPALISQVGACSLATDLMMRAANTTQISDAIDFFSFQLEHASPSQLQTICSKLRLSHSRYHKIVKNAKEVVNAMLGRGRFECDSRDGPITVPDNLQWQVGNKYFHCVPSTTQNISEERLVQAGIYNDEDESRRLSREPLDWPQYAADTDAQTVLRDVFWANDSDYSHLGEILLVHLTLVLQYLESFPDIEECQDRFVRKDWQLKSPLPVLFRLSAVADLGTFPGANEEPDDEDEPELEKNCPTIWDINDIHANPVVFANMGNKVYLRALVSAMKQAARDRSEDFNKDDNNAGKEPPMSNDFVFSLMDGSPNGFLRRMIDTDASDNASDDREYGQLVVFIGLFHLYMEVFKKTHTLTNEIIRFIAASFTGPNGDDNIEFFLEFPDPTKPEEQMSQIVLATMAYVFRCMKKDDHDNASAADAHKYMLGRARECPAAKAMLDLVLLYEIVMLSRRAISLNSYDLVLSVMKLSLPLLADTHATVYVRLFSDLLKHDKVMSDMERKFTEEFGLTVETVNGERKARDWVEEKYNCAIKTKVPTYRENGGRAKIEHAAMTVMQDEKRGGKRADETIREGGYRRSNRIELWTYYGETFIKVTRTLENSKIFESGCLLNVNGEEFPNDKYHSPINGEPVPADVMKWLSIGEERVTEYVTKFYIETMHTVYRSEEDMGLSPIMMSTSQASQHIQLANTLAFSVDAAELEKGTVPQLVQEIDRICELWHVHVEERPGGITDRTDKKLVINTLIRLRTDAFTKRNAEEIKARIRQDIELSCPFLTTEEDRTEELDHKFYEFVPSVFDNPELNEQHEL